MSHAPQVQVSMTVPAPADERTAAWTPPTGATLDELLTSGPLTPRQAALAVRDLALAVGALHERGLTHGSISPRSAAVASDGRARLLDPCENGAGAAAPGTRGPDDLAALGELLHELVCPVGSDRRGRDDGEARLPAALSRIRALATGDGAARLRTCGARARALELYLAASRFGLA